MLGARTVMRCAFRVPEGEARFRKECLESGETLHHPTDPMNEPRYFTPAAVGFAERALSTAALHDLPQPRW